jgi:hypothetical protein
MTTEDDRERLPQIRIRVSEQALSVLDAAAEHNGRSRNAEATARLEQSLTAESLSPVDRALVTFVSELTTRVLGQGLLGLVGPEGSEDEIQMLKGALCALLDDLGAKSGDPKAMELGASMGKRLLADARSAMAKEPAKRNPAEETLAEAAKAWGITQT